MIISHSRKFIFVHIHKAGGTSVERALDPHLAWNDLILGSSPLGERMQTPYSDKFGLNKHSSVADIEQVCGSRYIEEYYLFTIVRHPVARLCSIYNFVASTLNNWAQRQNIPLAEIAPHVTPNAAKKTPALKWPSSRAFLRSKNFSDFIRDDAMNSAPGFRVQAACLRREGGDVIAGEAFRLEDYPDWAEKLRRRLGVDDFQLPHENRSRLRLANPGEISSEDHLFIESRFAADYATFGYDHAVHDSAGQGSV